MFRILKKYKKLTHCCDQARTFEKNSLEFYVGSDQKLPQYHMPHQIPQKLYN